MGLKGLTQLWDHVDLDTSFLTLKTVDLHLKSNTPIKYILKSALIFPVFGLIFNCLPKNLFLSVLLLIL